MSYMVGVATDPIVRRSGVGKKLLKSALGELKQRGQGVTILMPSYAGFYQKIWMGFICSSMGTNHEAR